VNFFQTPGADQYAIPLYTMNDAIRLKEHVLKTLEAVDKNPALIDDGALNFCVVGGGSTGGRSVRSPRRIASDRSATGLPQPAGGHRAGAFVRGVAASARAVQAQSSKLRASSARRTRREGSYRDRRAENRAGEHRSSQWRDGEDPHACLGGRLKANSIVDSLGVKLAHGGRIPVGPDLQVKEHPGVLRSATSL